jgi:hypothetical protein
MARTEKKFGQVNQSSATLNEVVPTSANRRNILLNLTARSSANVTVATYNAAPSYNETVLTYVLSTPTLPTGIGVAGNASFTPNRSKTKIYGTRDTTSITEQDITISQSPSSTTASLATAVVKSMGSNFDVIPGRAEFSLPFSDVTSSDERTFSRGVVALDDRYLIAHTPSNTTTTSTEHRYAIIDITTPTSTNVSTDHIGTQTTITSYCGAFYLYNTSTSDGVGYLLAANSSKTTTTTNHESGAVIVFSAGASYGRVNWRSPGGTGASPAAFSQFFCSASYNNVNPVYAIASPNWASPWLGVAAYTGTGSISSNLPSLPSSQAPAGFRLVANDGAYGSPRKFLDGTVTYPAAPTGVTVPTGSATKRVVSSLVFSPDGTKLAVAYARDYSGTGNTNSVVVVYTRQVDGTYLHTHSSGSVISQYPRNQEGMAWSSDSTTIYVSDNRSATANFSEWRLDTITVNEGLFTWSNGFSKFPQASYYTSPTPLNDGDTTVSVPAGSNSALVGSSANTGAVYTLPGGSGYPDVVLVDRTNGGNDPNPTTIDELAIIGHAPTGSIGTGTAPGYVNSVASNLSMSAGQTVQISGAVLESGERLYINPSAADAIDAVAYGVEIS